MNDLTERVNAAREWIAEQLALEAQMTPGPWLTWVRHVTCIGPARDRSEVAYAAVIYSSHESRLIDEEKANAAGIAAARNQWRALLLIADTCIQDLLSIQEISDDLDVSNGIDAILQMLEPFMQAGSK